MRHTLASARRRPQRRILTGRDHCAPGLRATRLVGYGVAARPRRHRPGRRRRARRRRDPRGRRAARRRRHRDPGRRARPAARGGRVGARRGVPGGGRPGRSRRARRRSTPTRSRPARPSWSPTPGWAWCPHRTGAAVTWTAHPAARRQLPDVGEADRAAAAAPWSSRRTRSPGSTSPAGAPRSPTSCSTCGTATPVAAPAGVPPRCVDLAGRGPPGDRHRRPRPRGRRRRGQRRRDRGPRGRPAPAGPRRAARAGRRLLARGLAAGLGRPAGPHPELVAGRVGEVEAAPAGELVRTLDHLSSGCPDRRRRWRRGRRSRAAPAARRGRPRGQR